MGPVPMTWSPKKTSPIASYVEEYIEAFDRTEALGLKAPPRLLVQKDCVDPDQVMEVLLAFFNRHTPQDLVGQTAAINIGLIPLLFEATGVPWQLTIGWIEKGERPIFQHDESTLRRFLAEKQLAWQREGVPFHIWLTSPACEVLDVTFAMNLGWAKSSEECARLVIYQSAELAAVDPVYHPTTVGEDFFVRSGLVY